MSKEFRASVTVLENQFNDGISLVFNTSCNKSGYSLLIKVISEQSE